MFISHIVSTEIDTYFISFGRVIMAVAAAASGSLSGAFGKAMTWGVKNFVLHAAFIAASVYIAAPMIGFDPAGVFHNLIAGGAHAPTVGLA